MIFPTLTVPFSGVNTPFSHTPGVSLSVAFEPLSVSALASFPLRYWVLGASPLVTPPSVMLVSAMST